MAMKRELDVYTAELATEVGEDADIFFAGQIDRARESGIPEHSLKVGAKAPLFSLPGATGEVVEFGKLLQQGPVILTFYRGGWCPYCNIQLRAYQGILPTLKHLGASLVAVSPETPDKSVETKDREKLAFHVLSDADNAVARQFGLVFPLSPEVLAMFKDRWALDLERENGVDSGELPVPGTYVIDRDRTIVFASVDADFRRRTEPEEIIAALKSCAQVKEQA